VEPIPTDDEIRATPAYPRLVGVYRLQNRIFWTALPLFAASFAYWIAERSSWALLVPGLLALGNSCVQVYGIRAERQVLSEISGSPAVRTRARKLARDTVTPRLMRWLGT
jgi:hypothetical protein